MGRKEKEDNTFLFRQDLQFIDSRGSAMTRRGVRRSILTCGRDITAVDMGDSSDNNDRKAFK